MTGPLLGWAAGLIILATFLASALLTAFVRLYLVRRRVLDVPNERSSHLRPTPRGGGISIVVAFLLAVLVFMQGGALSSTVASALIGGGLAVATAGVLDDLFQVRAGLRLLVHFLAAGWALWRLNGMGPLDLGWFIWDWGWVGQIIGVVGLVWMINLYNYMDGINGLAGMEGVSVGGFGALLLAGSGMPGLAQAALALAGASAGFLVWNFPIAKVFMGDVGSGFLGFVFGVLAISSGKERPALLWCWLILLGVFVVDATVTQIRRWIGGARWHAPHRTSAYQHAARLWGHSKVTSTIAALNIAWLFPLAWGAYIWPTVAPLFGVAALAPLVYAAFRYGAGQEHLPRMLRKAEPEGALFAPDKP